MPSSSPRSGLSIKVTADVVQRLTAIKTLWLALQNEPLTAAEMGGEFYIAVGEILEGKTLNQLEFNKINKQRILQYFKEGQ